MIGDYDYINSRTVNKIYSRWSRKNSIRLQAQRSNQELSV